MNPLKQETSNPEIPVPGEEPAWMGPWLPPTGKRTLLLNLVVLVSIAFVSLRVYETGGTAYAWMS